MVASILFFIGYISDGSIGQTGSLCLRLKPFSVQLERSKSELLLALFWLVSRACFSYLHLEALAISSSLTARFKQEIMLKVLMSVSKEGSRCHVVGRFGFSENPREIQMG